MRVRPENQSTGEASPFNVITEAMSLRLFTEAEMRALYRQHTEEVERGGKTIHVIRC